jgi:hypothetical protein
MANRKFMSLLEDGARRPIPAAAPPGQAAPQPAASADQIVASELSELQIPPAAPFAEAVDSQADTDPPPAHPPRIDPLL